MAASVKSQGAILRVLPGDLFLVRYGHDVSVDCERVALWPVSNAEWSMLSPDGKVTVEELASLERIVKITGIDHYPADVDRVSAFEVPLEFEHLRARIAAGRKEARAARAGRGLSLTGPEPECAVDGWSGVSVALPAETAIGRLAKRITGKKVGPPLGAGIPTLGPKRPSTPPGDRAGGPAVAGPNPRKLFGVADADDLLAKEGFAWVCVDPFRSDKFSLGTTVDLSEGSVVRGNEGLFMLSPGEFLPVRQVTLASAPDMLRDAFNNLGRLAGVGEGGEPDTPHATQAAIIKDLRVRLAGAIDGHSSVGGKDPLKESSAGVGGASAKEIEDIRTLSVDYDDHGERFKRWRDFAREVSFAKFPDWPFEDSSSQSMYLVKHWDRHAEDGLSWLNKWFADRGVSPSERTGIEMKCLVTSLQLAGTYDHLNVPVLACLETIARRIAQIVEAYSIDARQPRWGGVHLYQGTTDAMSAIDPNLKANVVRKRKEELEVANLSNKVLGGGDHGGVGNALASPVPDGPGDGGWKANKRPPKKPLVPPGGNK